MRLSVYEQRDAHQEELPKGVQIADGIDAKSCLNLAYSGDAVIWILRREHCESEGEDSPILREALYRSASVIPEDRELTLWIEDHYRIATNPSLSLEQALRMAAAPVCVCVGAGLGNILQTTPMIRALSRHLGHPVDVFCYSPVPRVETLFGESEWVNMAFSKMDATPYRRYEKAFITGSVGHALPALQAKERVLQRRQYQMMEECRSIHETAYNFLGVSDLFPEFQHDRADEERMFIRNLTDESRTIPDKPSDTIVSLCDGKVAGTWMKREWDHFADLAAKLVQENYQVRSFGLKGQAIPGTDDWTGTSLRDCFYNISKSHLFVGSDGGLFHVAEALGVPSIVLFGPTSVIKNGPARGTTRIVHRQLSCSPCQWKLDFARCDNNVCMTGISVDDVLRAFNDLKAEVQGVPLSSDSLPTSSLLQQVLEHETAEAVHPYREELRSSALQQSIDYYPDNIKFKEQAYFANLHHQQFERCEQLLEIYGKEEQAHQYPLTLWKAELYFHQKKFEDSLRVLDAITDDSTGAAEILRCRNLLKLHRYQEVVELGCPETGVASKDAERCWLYGNACREIGEWDLAEKAFRRGLDFKPGLARLVDGVRSLASDTFCKFSYRKGLHGNSLAGHGEETTPVFCIMPDKEEVGRLSASARAAVRIYRYNFEEINDLIEELPEHAFVWVQQEGVKQDHLIASLPEKLHRACITGSDLNSALIGKVREVSHPKKRIVLFAHHHLRRWSPHGGEFSMHEIMQRLRSHDQYEILVVVANSKNTQVFSEVYEDLPYAVASQYRFADTVKNVLNCYQPDLALMWGPHSMKTGPICKSAGVPVCLFVRYWKVVCHAPYDRDVLEDSISEEERKEFGPLYEAADDIITNANHVSEVIKRRFGASSTCAYVPVQSPPDDYTAPDISERPYVTLINPRKASGEYIIRDLALSLPHIPFQVIGEPSISLPKNVKLLPYMKAHYTEILQDSRVLLFPFGEEPCGTGRVVFEAFYSKTPVVGPASGGLPEVIPQEWLVSKNENIDEWKKIVEELWTNPPREVISQLPKRMEQFDAERNLRIVDDAVAALLKNTERRDG